MTYLTAVVVFMVVLCPLTAQDFRGRYIVVATEITLTPSDTSSASRSLKYGDTVQVVARPTAKTFEIKVDDIAYLIRQSDVVRTSEFDRTAMPAKEVATGEQMEEASDSKLVREHSFRVGWGAGPVRDLSNNDFSESGLAWSGQVDVLLTEANVHALFGYQSITFVSRNSFGENIEVDVQSMSFGLSWGFGFKSVGVSPYVSLSLAICTNYGNQTILIPGFGVDWYVNRYAVIFTEVQPTLDVNPFRFLWVPLKVGVRCAL